MRQTDSGMQATSSGGISPEVKPFDVSASSQISKHHTLDLEGFGTSRTDVDLERQLPLCSLEKVVSLTVSRCGCSHRAKTRRFFGLSFADAELAGGRRGRCFI